MREEGQNEQSDQVHVSRPDWDSDQSSILMDRRKEGDAAKKAAPQISLIGLIGFVSGACLFVACFVLFGIRVGLLVAACAPVALISAGLLLRQRILASVGARLFMVMLVLSPVEFMAYATWAMSAHGAPLDAWNQLHDNMHRAQVVQLLGEPHSVETEVDGSEIWTYDRLTWCQMTVCFSASGRIQEFDHDH